jgi:hypothetical protein
VSGGSLDYVYSNVKEAADRIMDDDRPLYRAFGKHLVLVADALHAVEWEYSNDCGKGTAEPNIKKVLGDSEQQRRLEEILADMRKVNADILAALDHSKERTAR